MGFFGAGCTGFGESDALEGLNTNGTVCLQVSADQQPMVSADEFQNTSDRPVHIGSVTLVDPEAGLELEEWIVEFQAEGEGIWTATGARWAANTPIDLEEHLSRPRTVAPGQEAAITLWLRVDPGDSPGRSEAVEVGYVELDSAESEEGRAGTVRGTTAVQVAVEGRTGC